MSTYNAIATDLDRKHISNAKRQLGMARFKELVPVAEKAFKKAWSESSELKRENNARRAANLIFTKEMNK